ncbi:MAG: hypothetical protein GY754_06025 [bacterium]|nr:hypothetical protein [bacterium]
MKNINILFSLIIFLASSGHHSYAKSGTEEDFFYLEQIIVTATKKTQPFNEAPAILKPV